MSAKQWFEHMGANTMPALYVGFNDMLSDPVKLVGFIAMGLQATYTGIKILQAVRRKRNEVAA